MRWWILALLFLATLINYMDRTIFAVLVPVMRGDLHIDDRIYGYLTAALDASIGRIPGHAGIRRSGEFPGGN